jgi:hypothetical protein
MMTNPHQPFHLARNLLREWLSDESHKLMEALERSRFEALKARLLDPKKPGKLVDLRLTNSAQP